MSDLYDAGREGILDGSILVMFDTLRVELVAATYSPDLTADRFLSDIPAGARVAQSDPLTGVTDTGGTVRANNMTVNSVSGAQITRLVVWKDTGTPTSSRLVALIDSGVNLPYTPNGGSINVSWDTGINGIFRI